MTDDDKALVKRLRVEADQWDEPKHTDDVDMRGLLHKAAARLAEADALIELQNQDIERLREALKAYTEYCNICHGRGCIIEQDSVTGADLWRDCPGCKPARAALGETDR